MNISITKTFSKQFKLLLLIHILLAAFSFLVLDNILLREIAKHQTEMRGLAEGRISQIIGRESKTSFGSNNESHMLIYDSFLSYLSQDLTLRKQLEKAWGKGYALSKKIGEQYRDIHGK